MATRIRIEIDCKDAETVERLRRLYQRHMQRYSEGTFIITEFESIDMPDHDLVDGMLEWRRD